MKPVPVVVRKDYRNTNRDSGCAYCGEPKKPLYLYEGRPTAAGDYYKVCNVKCWRALRKDIKDGAPQ